MISDDDLKITKSGKPYVYLLCYPNGQPFYVGKGTNGRVLAHLSNAKNGECSGKGEIIRRLFEQGIDVLIRIDSVFETDQEALAREQLLIFQYGCTCRKTGILANVQSKTIRSNRTKLIHAIVNNNAKKSNEKSITIRFRKDIFEGFTRLAHAIHRSVNEQVNFLVEQWVREQREKEERKP